MSNLYSKVTQKHSDKFFGKIRGNLKVIEDAYWSIENFQTEHRRPVLATDVQTKENELKYTNVGIIIQGPIIEKYNFTLETVKLYKRLFEGSKLILSTWDNSKECLVNAFQELEIEVLTTNQPTNGLRENYQIVSTYEGILKAEELGCTYVMKTRTDQRIYAQDCLTYLFNLLEIFPLTMETKARDRIITMNLNTFSKRCYGITDMWLFGHIVDMKKYWDCEINCKQNLLEYWEKMKVNDNHDSNWRVVETYLASSYLKKIEYNVEWNLECYYTAIACLFIIIDKEMIDLFWPKYTTREYRWLSYTNNFVFKQINFKDWVGILHSYEKD